MPSSHCLLEMLLHVKLNVKIAVNSFSSSINIDVSCYVESKGYFLELSTLQQLHVCVQCFPSAAVM